MLRLDSCFFCCLRVQLCSNPTRRPHPWRPYGTRRNFSLREFSQLRRASTASFHRVAAAPRSGRRLECANGSPGHPRPRIRHRVRRVERDQRQRHLHRNLDCRPRHGARQCDRHVDPRRRSRRSRRFRRMVGGQGGRALGWRVASERHRPARRVLRHVDLERRSRGERTIRRAVRGSRQEYGERRVGQRRTLRRLVDPRQQVSSSRRRPMPHERYRDSTRRLPHDVPLFIAHHGEPETAIVERRPPGKRRSAREYGRAIRGQQCPRATTAAATPASLPRQRPRPAIARRSSRTAARGASSPCSVRCRAVPRSVCCQDHRRAARGSHVRAS